LSVYSSQSAIAVLNEVKEINVLKKNTNKPRAASTLTNQLQTGQIKNIIS
jgi:hypothetical protein